MEEKVLLFGFTGFASVLSVSSILAPLGIRTVPVPVASYRQKLKALDLGKPDPSVSYSGKDLPERLIVLCHIDRDLDEVLSLLKKAGAGPDCLKAALTPVNSEWDVLMLYLELIRERSSFQKKGK